MALKSTEKTLRKCMKKLMREKHLSKITVTDICEMAEIGKRTFYRYYPDKYALFEDTYIQEFFNKLPITEDTYFYDIYEMMFEQMYEEKEFFKHAIAIKGQNGFWEIIINLMFPKIVKILTSDPYIDKAKEFYIKKDIEVTLFFVEEWIQSGYDKTPKELFEFMRLCGATHGKWEYQTAMRYEIEEYSIDKFLNNEW